MSSQHTPGPWKACKDAQCPCGAIWDPTGEIRLATAFDESALGMEAFGSDIGVSRDVRKANARLIAAAPDLLFALRNLMPSNVGRLPDLMPDSSTLPLDVTYGELRTAIRAIAKATGASA